MPAKGGREVSRARYGPDVVDRLLGGKSFGMGAAGFIRQGRWKPKLSGSLPTFRHPDLVVLTLECIKLLLGNCLESPLLGGFIYRGTHKRSRHNSVTLQESGASSQIHELF
jgi:hypothetical protein